MIRFITLPIVALSALLLAASAFAGPSAAPSLDAKETSLFDKIWSIPVLYRDKENPFIEEFRFTGRYQGDYFNVDSRKGDTSFYENRRFRLGLETTLAEGHIILKGDLETNLRQFNTKSVFYNRMTNLYVKFHLDDAFNVVVGKQEPRVGYERAISDTLHIFMERGFFDDQFTPDYTAGVTVNGKIGNWGYQTSIYSGNVDKELGQFNGGESYLAEISYDFSKALAAASALLVLDYVHIEGNNAHTNIMQDFHNGVFGYFDFKKGKTGLLTQLSYGNGLSRRGDIYGLMLMPTYDITDKLQAVARYQVGLADESNGITTLNRQLKTVGKFTGDNYQAAYLGMNYYIYGQKLKLMTGVQYESLTGGTGQAAGNSGWTFLTGVRVFW